MTRNTSSPSNKGGSAKEYYDNLYIKKAACCLHRKPPKKYNTKSCSTRPASDFTRTGFSVSFSASNISHFLPKLSWYFVASVLCSSKLLETVAWDFNGYFLAWMIYQGLNGNRFWFFNFKKGPSILDSKLKFWYVSFQTFLEIHRISEKDW